MSRLTRVGRIGAAALIGVVRVYQWTLRPVIGAHCRFEPHCSAYAVDALHLHGPLAGSRLAAGRILRCNPWNTGGVDPVPAPCSCHLKGLWAR